MKKRFHVYISGRVQGVFFRAETQNVATSFNLNGWVRNTEDGRVEALFEGEEENIDQMLLWCHKGPPAARVDRVIIEEESYQGNISGFRIVH